ncbi:MAG: glutamate synthase subunit beta [Nitrospinae bacterium]|nr:glutamate synthase subunit beta [Nitrospinota bacterium]
MGKIRGFLEYERKTHQYLPVTERVRNYNEFSVLMSDDETRTQGARCMDCGVPFCHFGCPLSNIIPDFNDHVYNGRWQYALKTLMSTNNFPEITGRICPAPCESGCVLGIIKPMVAIKSIELAIIERGYRHGYFTPKPPVSRTGRKVAVIGSGPSGLAAADQLNKAGHTVTVYERSDRIGGLLRYGIPDFKLEKKVLQRRLEVMEAEGVTFIPGVNVGVTMPVSAIQQGSDAIVLACGSTIPRDLPIPGRDAKGVHFAMDFLTQNNKRVAGDKIAHKDEITVKGKHVVVIGGGDTGSDCVGTSIRQGAASVTQIELLPKPPVGRTEETAWPAHPGPKMFSTSSSQAEGCERDFSVQSKEFLKDAKGHVSGIRLARLEWEDVAKFKYSEIAGSEYVLKADAVFLAMGFLHTDPKGLVEQLGVEKDPRGNIKTGADYKTTVDGVYSAGDARRGQSLVVWAISEGRECAREVDKYLRGGASWLESKDHSYCEKV